MIFRPVELEMVMCFSPRDDHWNAGAVSTFNISSFADLRFRWSHACLFHARGRIGYRQFARYHSAAFLPHLVESNTSKEWNPGDLGRVHPRCPRTTIIPLRGQSASGKSPSLLLIPSPKFRLAEFGLCRGRFGLMCSIARFLLRLWLSNRHRGELCSRCS
jgi:hypothetical protein